MTAKKSMSQPDLDTRRGEVKDLRNLFQGQQTGLPEAIIVRFQPVATLDPRYDARCERLAFARLQTLAVQHVGDLWVSVVVQKPIDRGQSVRAGLPLFPGPLRQRELNRAMCAALEANMQSEASLSDQGDVFEQQPHHTLPFTVGC